MEFNSTLWTGIQIGMCSEISLVQDSRLYGDVHKNLELKYKENEGGEADTVWASVQYYTCKLQIQDVQGHHFYKFQVSILSKRDSSRVST